MIPRLLLLPFLVIPIAALQADTLLELDFQNFDEGARTVQAKVHRPEASQYLIAAADGVSVDTTQATGLAAPPSLATGSLLIGDTAEGGGFLQTTAASPETASYGAFVGTEGFGPSTIAFVFQPGFSGVVAGKGSKKRLCFFATNYRGTAPEGLLFQIAKDLMLSFGTGTASSPGQRVSLAQPDWDPAKWYLIAASWAPGEKPIIYWREIGTDQDHFAEGPEPLNDCPRRIGKAVRIGNSGHNESQLGGDNPINGRFAYFLWLNEYTRDRESFARLYQRITSGQPAE